ncbi:MAG: hypothetical protein KKC46_11980 [Proteobacteria bacterium]|nr:hypothetical protein [Pseudomonadota bacterium]
MEKNVSTEIPVPLPTDWAKIHSQLSKAWMLREDRQIPKPPVPLILAGAAFSSASAIRARWIDLINWTNEYGFSSILMNNLPESPSYDVAESIAGVSANGKGWWPEIGEQFHQPKQKPSKEIILATLNRLKIEWEVIVGIELGKETFPKKFTGKKARRLVVFANPNFSPPWGNWYSVNRNPNAFSKFRKTINAAISPMEVDNIDFNTEYWPNRVARG